MAEITEPVITGTITGPHTIALDPGQVVELGEVIQPETPLYGGTVAITAITVTEGGTVITTNRTFLPLNFIGKPGTVFRVISAD